ncbi:MAG: hypothetical protein QOH30_3853, partial [Baekduia sp.]|nr:hypothetical protein [Baekduia sp.]
MSESGRTDPAPTAFLDADLAVDVIDGYPYAILVQDADGLLLAHNQAASRLLGQWVPLELGTDVGCRILG